MKIHIYYRTLRGTGKFSARSMTLSKLPGMVYRSCKAQAQWGSLRPHSLPFNNCHPSFQTHQTTFIVLNLILYSFGSDVFTINHPSLLFGKNLDLKTTPCPLKICSNSIFSARSFQSPVVSEHFPKPGAVSPPLCSHNIP